MIFDLKRKIIENLKQTYCQLKPSKISGVGVFAIKNIPAGIDPFPLVKKSKWIRIKEEDIMDLDDDIKKLIDDFYVIEPEGVWISDAGLNGVDISFFVNHSKNPNLRRIESGDFITLREIKKGEELTVDYSTYDDKWKD
ncbi:MAG: SET domain-containing protein [Candidatus Nanoarchaeia archaeon]|nr:SET domain-containing protein [Candidatus Nanoarchaeia archaeon]